MHVSPNDIQLLITEAGGEIVGKTRLQKSAFILEKAGLGYGFKFVYHHYGPYSEELSVSADYAAALKLIEEDEKTAIWGGKYSVYRSRAGSLTPNQSRTKLLKLMKAHDAVQLELAATAFYLFDEGFSPPWDELIERKPEKSSLENIGAAKSLCAQLAAIETPKQLPNLGA